MRKITLMIVGWFALLLLVYSPAYADASCPTVTKTDIAALFEQRDQSLQTVLTSSQWSKIVSL